ncbi:hypothetical protein Tco_0661444 [Tanacetum coccineum]
MDRGNICQGVQVLDAGFFYGGSSKQEVRIGSSGEDLSCHVGLLKEFRDSIQKGINKWYFEHVENLNKEELLLYASICVKDKMKSQSETSNWMLSRIDFGGQHGSKEDADEGTILSRIMKTLLLSSRRRTVIKPMIGVYAASSKDQASTASYADDVMFSFFANQSNAPQLNNEDLEQIDVDDLEEMDLKWKVSMLTMRVKRAPRNQGNRNRDAPRRNAPMDTSTTNALVVQDGIGGYDWSFQAEEGLANFAPMAYTSQGSSSSSSSDSEYDVQVKDISIKDLKNQLEEALKEKDDLKLKLENFEESLKNLTKLINCQISAKDKTGLVNDRFKTGEGFHVVPPPYTRNYMPPRPDLSFAGLDESVFKPSAPIIEEWDTENDNDSVFRPKSDQTKPKFTKINFVKSSENVKFVNKENTHRQVEYPRKSQSPRDNRRKLEWAVANKSGTVSVNAAKQKLSKGKAASICTDIAKITRKRSKPDKHGHGKGKENTRAGRMLSKSYTSPNAPIDGNLKGNDARAKEKTHQSSGFCTKICVEEAQVP